MWTCVFLVCLTGVFGVEPVNFKTVTEGDSVTLYTDQKDIQRYKEVLWMFGDHDHCIAEISKVKNISVTKDFREMFTNKLKLNGTTGSLTITNVEFKNSGPYKLRLVEGKITSDFKFNVTVYARLPVPVIFSKVSSQCSSSSSSKCVLLLCSSMNVRDVSLSWYKGNSLLSNVSVSDLNIRLSLPLEVEYQDTNTYSCVVNNPITKQTQQFNINDVSQIHSNLNQCFSFTEAVIRMVFSALVGVAIVAILIYDIRSRRVEQNLKDQTSNSNPK
ncbi:CD48 antigen isoform X1 [Misgurnus anguillicaudatus]|uniref:CD48 antigen isoform X1 n=2 Tax=Misgurnus anguillicaudatus TaxID=75329 RepID=UPI003CCFD56A